GDRSRYPRAVGRGPGCRARHRLARQHGSRATPRSGPPPQRRGSPRAPGSLGRHHPGDPAGHRRNRRGQNQRRRPHPLRTRPGHRSGLPAMIPPDEEWQLDTRRLGRRVFVFRTLDSTNNLVLRWAEQGAEEGLAVLADEQTAGRGQHGRSWQSLPGAGVLLSLLVQSPGDRPAVLTAWAAAGVCRLIRTLLGVRPRLEWPNDVLLAGHKVCGILTERVVRGSASSAVVG